MKKLVLVGLLVLGACAPTFPFGPGNSQSQNFDFVGFHCVNQNPTKDGSVAFGPFGLKTNFIWFKQQNNDGTVSNVQNNCL